MIPLLATLFGSAAVPAAAAAGTAAAGTGSLLSSFLAGATDVGQILSGLSSLSPQAPTPQAARFTSTQFNPQAVMRNIPGQRGSQVPWYLSAYYNNGR